MKAIMPLLTGGILLVFTGAVEAQFTVPSTPTQFGKRSLSENGGSSGGNSAVGVVAPRKAPAPIIVELVAVSPVRVWTNGEGQTMNARLLAYSAPKSGEQGPVEVIRAGKVKFLLAGGKEPIEYPLEKLSPKDQIDIKAIAQAAKRPHETEPEGEEKKSEP